jgi:hypothetical protein
MVFLQGYVFVWSINPEVFCKWFSFKVMSLLLHTKHNFEEGPSTEHIWTNSPHKNITLKENHLQNTYGVILHTKT